MLSNIAKCHWSAYEFVRVASRSRSTSLIMQACHCADEGRNAEARAWLIKLVVHPQVPLYVKISAYVELATLSDTSDDESRDHLQAALVSCDKLTEGVGEDRDEGEAQYNKDLRDHTVRFRCNSCACTLTVEGETDLATSRLDQTRSDTCRRPLVWRFMQSSFCCRVAAYFSDTKLSSRQPYDKLQDISIAEEARRLSVGCRTPWKASTGSPLPAVAMREARACEPSVNDGLLELHRFQQGKLRRNRNLGGICHQRTSVPVRTRQARREEAGKR
ncbi:hypothetical protein MRB53_038784 [Persea americana]|nr:hypothetical protein MRB53_038784 [Persea americana]